MEDSWTILRKHVYLPNQIWMDGYFVYRRSTLKGHIASNKMNII